MYWNTNVRAYNIGWLRWPRLLMLAGTNEWTKRTRRFHAATHSHTHTLAPNTYAQPLGQPTFKHRCTHSPSLKPSGWLGVHLAHINTVAFTIPPVLFFPHFFFVFCFPSTRNSSRHHIIPVAVVARSILETCCFYMNFKQTVRVGELLLSFWDFVKYIFPPVLRIV